jgi:hypothetical protein
MPIFGRSRIRARGFLTHHCEHSDTAHPFRVPEQEWSASASVTGPESEPLPRHHAISIVMAIQAARSYLFRLGALDRAVANQSIASMPGAFGGSSRRSARKAPQVSSAWTRGRSTEARRARRRRCPQCPRTITSGGSPVARVSHGDRRQRDAGGVFAETASGSIGDRSCSAGPRPGLAGGRSAAGSGKRPKSAQRSSVAPGPPVRAVRSACISSTTRIQEMLSRWPHRQPDTQGTGQPAHCD